MNSRRNHRRSKVAVAKCRDDKLKIDEFQPQILRKPEIFKDEKEDKKNLKVEAVEVPAMTKSSLLLTVNSRNQQLLKFLEPDNSNFYVVGVIGTKNSGKTTVMNLIATGDYKRCEFDKTFYIEGSPFGETINCGVEAFITKERVILLDSIPILFQDGGRDFILNDADDIRQIQMLFSICHELIVVFENNQIINLARLLICSWNMMEKRETKPVITLIENRVQPGCFDESLADVVIKHLAKNISNSINSIKLLDISRVAYYHEDPKEIIRKLRDDINLRKELKAFKKPTETEKVWWDKSSNMNLAVPLVKEFEALRGRFYQ